MSNVTLLNVVKGRKIIDREFAQRRYLELLQNGGVEHAEELVELSNKLGKSIDQISEDARILERFAEAEKGLQIGIDTDARTKAAKAMSDLQRHQQETKEMIVERERVRVQLDYAEIDSTHALSTAVRAEDLLRQLKQQRPDLLGTRTILHI